MERKREAKQKREVVSTTLVDRSDWCSVSSSIELTVMQTVIPSMILIDKEH